MDRQDVALTAQMDQLDAMLADQAANLHEIASKEPDQWTGEDWKLVRFAIHASAARAAYIRGNREDGEEAD